MNDTTTVPPTADTASDSGMIMHPEVAAWVQTYLDLGRKLADAATSDPEFLAWFAGYSDSEISVDEAVRWWYRHDLTDGLPEFPRTLWPSWVVEAVVRNGESGGEVDVEFLGRRHVVGNSSGYLSTVVSVVVDDNGEGDPIGAMRLRDDTWQPWVWVVDFPEGALGDAQAIADHAEVWRRVADEVASITQPRTIRRDRAVDEALIGGEL